MLFRSMLIPPGDSASARPGQVVVAEIITQPAPHAQPIARIVEVLGNYADPGMEIEIALRKHELPYEFPPAVENACRRFNPEVTARDAAGRVDVRELPLVTIDGETARDFDDAVYCEPKGAGFRLVVAIADVSHYVAPGDALDREALARRLGRDYEILRCGIKRWSAGGPIQAPLHVLRDLVEQHGIRARDVAKLVVRMPDKDMISVNNRDMPDICVEHQLALMLADGRLTFRSSHDFQRMRDPRVLRAPAFYTLTCAVVRRISAALASRPPLFSMRARAAPAC